MTLKFDSWGDQTAMRKTVRRLILAGIAAFGATGAVAAEVNVYSARHYDVDDALFETFTAETGIEVNIINGTDDELQQRLKAEGANSPADVYITVDGARLWRAVEAKVFQPARSKLLEERVPANLRHPDGLWYGITKRARVIMYDKTKGAPEGLDSYEDLADPQYKGVCIRSSSNAYNQSLLGSIVAVYGEAKAEEWAKGLAANLGRPPQGGDRDQIKAVAAGECVIAVVNTYYLGGMLVSKEAADRAMAEKIGVIFPNQAGDGPLGRGTHVNISGAGVVATAPNRDEAVEFIEFLISDAAQEVFSEANQEYPVVLGESAPSAVAAWGPYKEDQLNVAVFGENSAKAVEIADRAGWK